MKHLSALLSSALIVVGANAEWRPIAAEGTPDALAEIDARVARWSSLPHFDASKLSVDERRRLAAHEGGIITHPFMTYDALGVRYDPIYDLPVSTFHDELTTGRSGQYAGAKRQLLRKFNIQLLSPSYSIEWPQAATLVVDLSKDDASRSFAFQMELRDGDAYYMRKPDLLGSAIRQAVTSLGQYPRMTLVMLEGFEFSPRTITDMPPLGVAVTYNVRFGNVRVDTGFQWAGRPAGIPNGGEDFLR